MGYSMRFVPDGILVIHKGKTYRMIGSRQASSFAGLKEAKHKADVYVKHLGGIAAGYLVARIPNTHQYGIFALRGK